MANRTLSPLDRFNARVDRSDPSGCWIWTGGGANGYGRLNLGARGKKVYAHRWAYEHYVGPIPDGLLVDHICRNTACVNPAHLRLADRSLNAQNVSGPPSSNKSGERGVFWEAPKRKWITYASINGRRVYGQRFDDYDEAVVHVRELRNQLHAYNDIDRM